MTLKEIFKKINTYNEIAKAIGTEMQVVEFTDYAEDCAVALFEYKGTDYKQFEKAIFDEYFDEYADEILNFKNFDFDRDAEIKNRVVSVRILEA